jgi:isopropylmalate/isohomocitrate dehydrogenase-like protein
MAMYNIALVPGDGIGREVIPEAARLLESTGLGFEFNQVEVGYAVFKVRGSSVPDDAVEAIKENHACLFGATTTPLGVKDYRSAIVTLRRALNVYANIRPAKSYPVPGTRSNIDLVVVRENTEGLYSGIEYGNDDSAFTVRVITRKATKRVARFAFELAMKRRKKVSLATKANIMRKTCGLFRQVSLEVSEEYPEVEVQSLNIDVAALHMVMKPEAYDVILAPNLFGDILSDESAGLVGGLGLAPSANIGDSFGLFEPVHGSAPDIANKGIANPTAAVLSASMMLEYLGEEGWAMRLEEAVVDVLSSGRILTPDMGGRSTTVEMVDAFITAMKL